MGDDWFDWFRIGGSLVVGLSAAVSLWIPAPARIIKPVIYFFIGWTVFIWTRSMMVNWFGSGSIQFKLVHTILAIGFGFLVWWVLAFARRDLVSGPDQTDR